MYTRKTVSTVLLIALFASSLFTQTGGTFDMSTNAVTSGGERSVSGNILLESTLGQPVVGSRSNTGTVEFYGGFWSIFASAAGGAVTISPDTVSVPIGSPQAFSVSGGFAPYTYSLVQNISGAMINPTSGVYTAGPNGGIDIVRVTDGEGSFDEATVTVTAADIACPGGQKLWDGGGLTNNWSEPANWCGNILPDSGSVIVFNGTSSKNAIVDINADVNSFNLNAGFSGTVAIAAGITVGTVAGSTFNAGTFDAGGGTLNLASTFNTLNGGTFNAGSGTVNINFFLNVSGGTFNGGNATLSIPVVNVIAGSFISTTGTLSVSQNIQLTGGRVDLDNGTIVFTGTGNGSVSGTNGPFNNLTINKADNFGVSFAGTNIVNGSLNLTDGLINTGTLEARGAVNFASAFGQPTGAGDGVIALRNSAAARIVSLPNGVSLPDLIVDDANTTVSANSPGLIQTDSITLNNGSIDIGSSDMTFGYTTGGSGSNYLQTGGSFSISTGNIVWNSFGNFTLSNGAFNAGSGTVHLGGNIFTLSGGTFTPSTGSNTFNFDFNNAFEQSGGVFGTGAGSIDINGRFTLSGGTFNASAGNTSYGFVFDHTAGTFNNNAGTVIFDSPHPAYTLNVPGNPGTGVFNNVTMNPTTDNANVALGSDTFEVNGNLQILNGQMTVGRFAARGNVTIEAAADGGNAEMNFGGSANQRFTNNGGLNTTGTWTVDKTGGAVIAGTDLQLETTQPLNINSGTLYLEDSSDLTAGAITIGTGGRLVNDSTTVIALGGILTNDGRIELAGGGVSCPQTETIVIRSTSDGVPRAWNGTGAFRISDSNIKDMAGNAAITAFSSTDGGGNGINWAFDAGCPTELSISPQYTSVGSSQSQVFTASGGAGTRTFSILQNNSGGSIDPVSGLYTSGSVSGVTDVVRVTDGNNNNADAFIPVVPGIPTALTLLPATAAAVSGQTVQFDGVGGTAPYFYSITTNNSGGSINPSTGLYTAGPNSGIDTIRVTDGNNDTAQSTVTVMAVIPPNCITATIPSGLVAQNGDILPVSVQVGDTTGQGVTAFDFTVSFDPTVLTPTATPFSNSGTMSSAYMVTANPNTPGILRIVGFGVLPLSGSGTLVDLQFDVIGVSGDFSPISLTAFEFNEGTPCATLSSGGISVIGGSISGKVTYGNAAVETPVANTTLTLSGATIDSDDTDAAGLYILPGVNPGSNTVAPSKSGDVNGISGFDASQVALHVAGLLPLSVNQQIASDTSSNGRISAFDASLIAQYVAGLAPPGVTGTWRFVPASRNYVDIAVDQIDQDYTAILMGEVSGNWAVVSPLGSVAPDDIIEISMKPVLAHRNSVAVIPIRTERLTGRGIFAFQFDVIYDPLVIQPAESGVEKVGTLSRQMNVVENELSPGVLRVVVFGTNALSGFGNLINLRFDTIGDVGSRTKILLSNFQFNEGVPVISVSGGQLEVIPPSPPTVSMAGRAITSEGKGIGNAVITITDQLGNRRFAFTNQFGHYHFNDVPNGQSYKLNVKSKGFVFDPPTRTVTLSGPLSTVDFIGSERAGTL